MQKTKAIAPLIMLVLAATAGCAPAPRPAAVKVVPEATPLERLERAIRHYRRIEENGGWPFVTPGPKIQRGEEGERVLLLKQRLAATGDLGRRTGPPIFDEEVEAGVARFQLRHGLEPDGIVNDDTLAALNVPVEARIRQLEINADRRRRSAIDPAGPSVVINIPDFTLGGFDRGQVTVTTRVVVGQRRLWQTPILDSAITHLILNPQWHVPVNIIKKELFAKIREDPAYVGRERMRLYLAAGERAEAVDPETLDWSAVDPTRLRLVQREGPWNALGRIKFMFPNRYEVYLHDTPAQRLFQKRRRALSHGCVRVEGAMDLATFLMRDDPAWSREAILKAIGSGKNRTVPLPAPVDVHLVYWTAWVDREGHVQFRDDLYGLDPL